MPGARHAHSCLEEVRMALGELFEFAKHPVKVQAHGVSCTNDVTSGDHVVYRRMLLESRVDTSPLRQQGKPNSLQMRAQRIQDLADPIKPEIVDDEPVEARIELVETLQVIARQSGPLIGQVVTEPRY